MRLLTGTMDNKRRLPGHAAKMGRLFERAQILVHSEPIVSQSVVGLGPPTGGAGDEQSLTHKLCSTAPIGKPMLPDEVQPLLEQSGCRVPIEGKQQRNHLMRL